MSNIMRRDFMVSCCSSDGTSVAGTERNLCVLWNSAVIKEDDVELLIMTGAFMRDDRIIVTSPEQADNLIGSHPGQEANEYKEEDMIL